MIVKTQSTLDSTGWPICDVCTKFVQSRAQYSWIGYRWELGLTLAFGLSMSDFNSESIFGILTKNYTQVFQCFLGKTRIEFSDFLLAIYGVIFYLFQFWRFASTMVAFMWFLGESVTDGGKYGRCGKPKTTQFTCDHHGHVETSLTCFARPCFMGHCMAWHYDCSRAKWQNDAVLL